ncbi:hypothetical protein M407DRAFT_245579 [Tulasnella calospora MUT 4182]|uniref:DUF6532 domain-containing protein n=1 Tax=Tulasnella calospora MUT 4182 TaxID=1051891 RepID=A0A0C3QAF8_9AGAM|nr:hypothetical protein M407DRAFT_245579 [Tulasnella calospora MUT 4182]
MGQKNRRRYLTLVENDAYIYEKSDTLDGPYYHPLCYKIIKASFFSRASDDGIVFSEFFNPIRPQTIALVYTAIRMCLDEWKSGSYKPLNFTSDLYEPIYKSHLANLKAMGEDDSLFLKGLGDELWEDCSEPFDLAKATQPMVTIYKAQKASGIKYGQERRNARAAQKAAAAAATSVDMALDE